MWLINAIIFFLCYITSCSYGYADDISVHLLGSTKNGIFKTCKDRISEYEAGLKKREKWALQMYEASAKFPSSEILSGHLVYLGDFDKCLSINHNSEIFGKYCLGGSQFFLSNDPEDKSRFRNVENQVTPETRIVGPHGLFSNLLGLCLPDSCFAGDFQEYYKNSTIKLRFSERMCVSRSSKPKLDVADITIISFLSVILCIILMSTAYEALTSYIEKKSVHPVLTAFSLITNTKNLLKTTSGSNSGQISCLHGIRVITTMWVIIGRKYNITSLIPFVNPESIDEWISNKENMIMLSFNVAADTFFLLTGLLISYGSLMAISKGLKFNIILYYLHRFLRLTPVLFVLVLIHTTVLRHLGSGPLWNILIPILSRPCETYWWSTLLYIQNYINPYSVCINQSWQLSLDAQLFLFSPLILLPLKHSPKIGLALTGLLTIGSIIACFTVGWIYELSHTNRGETIFHYLEKYYFQPFMRAGPWLIGIVLGYIIFEIKQKPRKITINIFISILLWLLSLAILLACVFSGHNMLRETYTFDRFANAIYLALMRPGWALGVSWVIFACITGHGGPVNWFLSLPVFQVVSKVTYSMYLLHMTIIYVIIAQARTAMYFDNFEMMYQFWSDFAYIFGTAIIFTLAFESPILNIEKIILGKKAKSLQSNDQVKVADERTEKLESDKI